MWIHLTLLAALQGQTPLPGAAALAVSPQGEPFIGTAAPGGRIAHWMAGGVRKWFVETGGKPLGLAFDAAGDLLVADAGRRAVLRVTPWRAISVVAERCDGTAIEPSDVSAAADGRIYVSDAAGGRICEARPGRPMRAIVTDLDGPRSLVASGDGRRLFLADGAGTIWVMNTRGRERRRFARFEPPARPAGMALDEAGNLYVALVGAGQLAVLSPEGQPLKTYTVPGSEASDVAFGGPDLDTLYVTEASAGALYKFRALARSQRLPWEPEASLLITTPPDGAILNRHDGELTPAGLRIQVEGRCQGCREVRINGNSVPVAGGRFQSSLVLGSRQNRISVEAPSGRRHSVTVLWDRDSFPRYRVSTDDNIRFLADIARNAARYRSIFDNPYLAFWREMHRKYGAKVHHNIYYETEGFNLSQMPAAFRDEWRANADWMRLTFHARANDPDRPYLYASASEISADYRLVTREIRRFAGEELLSPVTTIHWGAITLAAARALREEGIRVLVGYFEEREALPRVSYYLFTPQWRHLLTRDYWKDLREDLVFVRHDLVINTVPLEEIVPHLERVARDPHQAEVIELMIHEQYFYPDYIAYQPDFRQRVERAIRWASERGYRPVFYEEGFPGAEGR